MSKSIVKNRAPAPIQISAEQILREAQERQEEPLKPTRRRITDAEELDDYRLSRRKAFEDELRRQRHHIGTWIKYALWEESQKQYQRARSIFERALDVDYKEQGIWLKYAEMEMKNAFVNHARNVWERAISLLPRVNQFWYKYAYMEEMLGNIDQTRDIFNRWLSWEPDTYAFYSYIKFEERCQNRKNNINNPLESQEKIRNVYEKFISCHPYQKIYIKYAKWEEKCNKSNVNARKIYERGFLELPENEINSHLLIEFANFEERNKEYTRAKEIYQFALDKNNNQKDIELYNSFIKFEKKYGKKNQIENILLAKKRSEYELSIQDNKYNYDIWFQYIKMEEEEHTNYNDSADLITKIAQEDRIEELYERAIGNIPIIKNNKNYWRKYIYLWIKYCFFNELIKKNYNKTNDIYNKLINDIIPHKYFTFNKIFIFYAEFLIRNSKKLINDNNNNNNMYDYKKVFGHGIGLFNKYNHKKKKLLMTYYYYETKFGNITNCRIILEKLLLMLPLSSEIWLLYINFEINLKEIERARSLFELAIQNNNNNDNNNSILDIPELIYKKYIEFEINNLNYENVSKIYNHLLNNTKHYKVWISYAKFYINIYKNNDKARDIFNKAYHYFKQEKQNKNRFEIYQEWKIFEESLSNENNNKNIIFINNKKPKKIMKKRQIVAEDGTEMGTEEYSDYSFSDDEGKDNHSKLLEAAHLWKKNKKRMNEDI